MEGLTKLKERKQLLSKQMDFEMLNYLLDNVKNGYELPEGEVIGKKK